MHSTDLTWYARRAVAQVADPDPGGGVDVDVDLGTGIGGSAGSAVLTTLIVGLLLIALKPQYTERKVSEIWDEPVGSLLWGILGIGGVIVLAILLVISLVGILLVIPFLIVAYVAWAVGSTIAFLAVAERIAEAFDLVEYGEGSTAAGSGTPTGPRDARDPGGGRDGARDGDRSTTGDQYVTTADGSWSARRDGRSWLVPLGIAALLNGALVLTGVGGLVAFLVGLVGFGALLQDWLESATHR